MNNLGASTVIVPEKPIDEAEEQEDYSWRVKNQLRILFWLCYWLDKEICIRAGQPPFINDDDCDLSLPTGYLGIIYAHDTVQASRPDDAAIPLLPSDIRLNIIKSKIYRLLYSVSARRKSDAEVIRDILQLDCLLEEWRLSVPVRFRPSLTLQKHDTASDLSPSRAVERIMIQLEYRNLLAKIHHATGRCRSWFSRNSSELERVTSSLALAVEASRSTLYFLRAIADTLMGEFFW